MANKTGKTFLFETRLNWLSEDRGIMYAHASNGPIYTSSPAEFGGSGKEWSPEHLLLSALNSCYMATFLGFAKKTDLTISRLECSVVGQVKLVNGKYKFTQMDVYPKIFIANEALHEMTAAAVHKTEHYCLISNSIDAEIIYHTEILKDSNQTRYQATAGSY